MDYSLEKEGRKLRISSEDSIYREEKAKRSLVEGEVEKYVRSIVRNIQGVKKYRKPVVFFIFVIEMYSNKRILFERNMYRRTRVLLTDETMRLQIKALHFTSLLIICCEYPGVETSASSIGSCWPTIRSRTEIRSSLCRSISFCRSSNEGVTCVPRCRVRVISDTRGLLHILRSVG